MKLFIRSASWFFKIKEARKVKKAGKKKRVSEFATEYTLANAAKNTVNQFQKHHSQKSQENAVCTLSL